jgi:hypothetical protein
MNNKIQILSIGAAILLMLTFLPTSAFELPINENKISQNASHDSELELESAGTVKINVYHIKGNNRYSKTVKELTVEDEKAFWQDLKNIELKDYPSIVEFFEAKIEVVKEYELISNDFKLEDIMDVSGIGEVPHNSEGFEAAFAPILFAGGGIGLGLGIPFFLSSGVFLVFLLGFGLCYCYDFATEQLFELWTYSFIPILMGYLGGFTGLLLLPVVSGFFYSNLLGIGMSALTIWNEIPEYY